MAKPAILACLICCLGSWGHPGSSTIRSASFAARMHQQAQEQDYVTNDGFQRGQFYTYPNGATKSGSAQNVESGAEFNLLEHPVD